MIKSAVVAGVVLLSVTGCGSSSESGGRGTGESREPSTFKVQGTLTLTYMQSGSETGFSPGADCQSNLDYTDVRAGAQVVVRDADGKDVGLGQLGSGKFDNASSCLVPFEVDDVPTGSNIYSVEVAHRGEVKFNRSDAAHLSITLGN
jgi:hypothetical protein